MSRKSTRAHMMTLELQVDGGMATVNIDSRTIYVGPVESAMENAGLAFARTFLLPLLKELGVAPPEPEETS